MRNLLSPEGPLMSFLTKLSYSAYLNVLWFICCLPVVTIQSGRHDPGFRRVVEAAQVDVTGNGNPQLLKYLQSASGCRDKESADAGRL